MGITDRILSVSQQRVAEAGELHRSDMRLTDHVRVGSNQAKIMVQYDILRPAPTLKDLERWVTAKFDGKVHLVHDTATRYKNEPSLTVVASLTRMTRPISDAKNMHNFTLGAYADVTTGSVWEVQEMDDGSKYLVAKVDEDLEAIFKKHTQRPVDRRVAGTLAALEKTASRVYNVGDTVKFVDGDTVLRGDVTSCSGNTCTVKANGGSRSIDCSQITDVVRRAPQNVNEERNELDDYYTKAYGDKNYADSLTHTMSKDVAEQHNPAASAGPRKV